jgi:hypothetical protein
MYDTARRDFDSDNLFVKDTRKDSEGLSYNFPRLT